MKTKLIILGCGNSMGTPRIDGFWGSCNKKNKKNIRTRCSAIILRGSNSILIDTSPDIRNQLIDNKIKSISSNFVSEEVNIKELDYFFTNAISRASKTMSECRQIKQDSKKTGTDN